MADSEGIFGSDSNSERNGKRSLLFSNGNFVASVLFIFC